MRKIILVVGLMLLVCWPVAANPVTIKGVGQVELGEDIVVAESQNKKGEVNYHFRAKDGSVWRGALLMLTNAFPDKEVGNAIKMDVFLDQVMREKVSKDSDVLGIEKARQVSLGGKEFATATAKLGLSGAGFVANMDMILISGAEGLNLLLFMCADSDAQYWRPIMQKIAISIP